MASSHQDIRDNVVFGLTRGAWRLTLFAGFAAHVAALVCIGIALFETRKAGGSGLGGFFCLADTEALCPDPEKLVDASVPGEVACSASRLYSHHNSSSCLDHHTMRCIREEGCEGAYMLTSQVLDAVRLKHVDKSSVDAHFFAGLGCFFLYLISFGLLEFPFARDSYARNSISVPERIFLQPHLIGISCILKASMIVLLYLLKDAVLSFPSAASCADVNLLPSIEDVKLHTQSRTQFQTQCETMVSLCRISIVGVPLASLNTASTESTSQQLNSLLAICLVLIVGTFLHKWIVWCLCVSQTVDGDAEAAYLRELEVKEAEQFELAIQRIQARRRAMREQRQQQQARRLQNVQRRRVSEEISLPRRDTESSHNRYVNAASLGSEHEVIHSSSNLSAGQESSAAYVFGEVGGKLSEHKEENNFDHSSDTGQVEVGGGDMECIICLEMLIVGGSVEALACGHVFHSDCISQWFEEGGQGRLCPLCRQPS